MILNADEVKWREHRWRCITNRRQHGIDSSFTRSLSKSFSFVSPFIFLIVNVNIIHDRIHHSYSYTLVTYTIVHTHFYLISISKTHTHRLFFYLYHYLGRAAHSFFSFFLFRTTVVCTLHRTLYFLG